MTDQEKVRALALIDELEKEALEKLRIAKESDPFWFFEPSDGTVTSDGMNLLKKYLKEEDIPQKFDSQMDALRSTASICAVSGGNQAGKTNIVCIKRLIKATGEVPESLKGLFPMETIPKKSPRRYRVVAEDFANGLLKNIIPTYQKWVPREYLVDGKWEKSWSAQANTLTLVNPKERRIVSSIEFMSNAQDVMSHQGPPLDGIDFDEEPRYEIYKENLVRMTTAERFDMQFGMTPTHGMSWTYDAIFSKSEDESGNRIDWFKLASVTNKRANLTVVEEIIKGIDDYNEIKMRLLGEFVSLSGLIYGGLFNPRAHLIEPFPVGGENYVVYRGLDPHSSKPTYCVEIAVDRDGNEYACGLYKKAADTSVVKADLASRASERKYRLGKTVCDRSADSDNHALGDRNIFYELGTGENAIPALDKSEKYKGSIDAGVDQIKQKLRVNPVTNKPSLFVFNTPEMADLIRAFKTMERETFQNEKDKGMKDKIKEGPHDAHAAFRYPHQIRMGWFPPVEHVPEPDIVNDAVGW